MPDGGRSLEKGIGQGNKFSWKDKLTRFLPARFKTTSSNVTQAIPGSEQVIPTPIPVIQELPAVSSHIGDEKELDTTNRKHDALDQVEVASPKVEVLPPRRTGINQMILRELGKRKLTLPEIENRGVQAIIRTNEAVGSGFFEAVQAKNPDGYLIGVGAGNVFTMLHCFQEGVIPRGIVLSDIDPAVIAVGKLFVKGLRETESAEQLQNGFFKMPEDQFQSSVQQLISEETDAQLKAGWEKMNQKTWHDVWVQLGERESITWKQTRSYQYEGQNIDVRGAISDKFTTLKQLAMEDNIAVTYADFTDYEFIEAVTDLPNFDKASNIIYFSNIVDHITRRGTDLEQLKFIKRLGFYKHMSKAKTYYIDTLGQGLNYFLRARESLADFSEEDFAYRGMQPRENKPDGLLFADVV